MKPSRADIERYIQHDFDTKVPEYWEKIEHAVDREIQPLASVRKKTWHIQRMAAIAACLAFLITASVLSIPRLFDGFNQLNVVYGQDTPVRIGRLGSINASFEKPYTFAEAYEEADLVAQIVITEWLGELDQEGLEETTYFKARIVEEYKNDLEFQEKEFVLLQSGNSNWTYKGYPLFKNGDSLLLCLKWMDPAVYSSFVVEREDCFSIVAGQLTEMQIVDRNGQKFALTRNLSQNFIDIENLAQADSVEIMEYALKQDAVLAQAETRFECVYPLEDLVRYMDDFEMEDKDESEY